MKFISKYKTYLTFTLSSSIYNIVLIATNFIAIKWIQPKDIGLWNSVFLYSNYIALMQLGVFNTINRDIPFYYGKNEIDKVKKIVEVGSWFARFLFLINIFFTLFILIYLFLTHKSIELKITALSIGLITALSFYQNFLIVTYRTSSQFNKLANVYLSQSIIVVLSLFLVVQWSYYGFVLRNLILIFFFSFFAYKNRPFKLKPIFDKKIFINLLKVGVLFYIVIYAINITSTFARLFLLNHTGIKEVGLFFPAIGVIMGMELIPSSISQIIYPKLSYEVGKSSGNERLFSIFIRSSLLTLILLSIIAALIYFLFPLIILRYFPLYSESIDAVKYSAIAGIFTSGIIYSILLSQKKWKLLYSTALLKLLIFGFLIDYFIKNTTSAITGAAKGWLISNIIFYFIIFFLILYTLKKNESY